PFTLPSDPGRIHRRADRIRGPFPRRCRLRAAHPGRAVRRRGDSRLSAGSGARLPARGDPQLRGAGHPGAALSEPAPGDAPGVPQFPDWLAQRLGMANVDAHCVVLELTEHGRVQHESQLAAAIRPLRRMGCDIAIDDLGAGSSGLKTWSALRPEFVKVDRYFVAGIEEDPVRGEILRSVVEMARATGSQVVAEGIEN